MMIPEVHGCTRTYIVLLSCGVPVRLGGTGTSRRLFMVFLCFFFLSNFHKIPLAFLLFLFRLHSMLLSFLLLRLLLCLRSRGEGAYLGTHQLTVSPANTCGRNKTSTPPLLPPPPGRAGQPHYPMPDTQSRVDGTHMNARIPTYTHIYYIFRFFPPHFSPNTLSLTHNP